MRSRIRVVAADGRRNSDGELASPSWAPRRPRPRPPPAVAGSTRSHPGDPIESTTPAVRHLERPGGRGPTTPRHRSVPPTTRITTSGGTTVGCTRNFSLTFNKTPKSAAPASGTAYYYFSVNGTNWRLRSPTRSTSPAGQVQAGTTLNGSFPITSAGANTVGFARSSTTPRAQDVRVGCNGQTGAVLGRGVNPATTPVDTNITASFTVRRPDRHRPVDQQPDGDHARPQARRDQLLGEQLRRSRHRHRLAVQQHRRRL